MTLRLILGDQLNSQHSWFQHVSSEYTYVLMEMRQETDYTKHHIQKVVAFFLSMRNFAAELKEAGHQVTYLQLDDERNKQDLVKNIETLAENLEADQFQYLLPDEYRLDQQLSNFQQEINDQKHALLKKCESFDTEHFFTKREDLAHFFKGKKTFIMENFYRSMRKKHGYLMEGDEPYGGKWNYDHENRKKLPKKHEVIEPKLFSKDVNAVKELLELHGVETMGSLEAESFIWPTSHKECEDLLSFFIEDCLEHFGTYEDAMTENSWSVYHSRLSFAMNSKMLSPEEVIEKTIAHWEQYQDRITIAQVEGFVRQILGWREFMRGIYWAHMPSFATKNFLEHKEKLPEWFWTGEVKMNCMKHSIGQSLDKAYAHHIQRLMVIGNFALLAGINPDELDEWYLGVYIDAIEWVEITNTRGMSQFADGGIVGTKPYVSSANYIHKMSDYCSNCSYDYKKKTGDNACPFNWFYWHFYERHRENLAKNPRIGMAYRLLDKMDDDKKKAILKQAECYLSQLNSL